MRRKLYEVTVVTDCGTSTFEVEAKGVNDARKQALTFHNGVRGRVAAIRPIGYAQQEA